MKILSAKAIREWDQYTIEHEPIASIDLMERAAQRCVDWILQRYPDTHLFSIFCGKGNNGGDGLAIARLLLENNRQVLIHILEFGHLGTADFQTNLSRLHHLPATDIHFIQSEAHLHPVPPGHIIIDAILGSGLNRETEGLTAALVQHINKAGCRVISIDIPSGLFTDKSSKGVTCIHADHTLSFQCYKKALLVPENEAALGEVVILDIGLHPGFYLTLETDAELIDEQMIRSLYRPRKKFAHKGNFGHALMVTGSYGKMGAAVLSAKACLRSGAGLLTCHIPASGYEILQSTVPEAMVVTDLNTAYITRIEDDLEKYNVIGTGPGMGTAPETMMVLRQLLTVYNKPMVLDADALNCMAMDKDLLSMIPEESVLTPHPKEFERLFGRSENDFERMDLALSKAKELNLVIVLKGHHSNIATPGGHLYFNATGNPGMATAGSGDVLTGIITGLLAQGYPPVDAAITGVYLHGLAGDLAAKAISEEAMLAGDITEHLGAAFRQTGLLKG